LNKNKINKPDFLVIGAQKSATSWLYFCLQNHPDIYLPSKKELRYFDRAEKYNSPNILAIDSPFKRYNLISFINKLIEIIKKHFKLNKSQIFFWYLKYYFGYYNDRWYISLFNFRKKNQICGEVTPSYSILEIEDIKKIYEINSEIKIIFLIKKSN